MDVSLLEHVQAFFALREALLLWFGFVLPSKERSTEMGLDIIDQFREREICELVYGIIMQTESTQNFSTLLLCKKN